MASEVMKLIFAVLDVSFNSGQFTVIIKRQHLRNALFDALHQLSGTHYENCS